MRGKKRALLLALVAAIAFVAIPATSPPAEARSGLIITPPVIAVDGCGTIQTSPIYYFGMPFGTCKVWLPDPGSLSSAALSPLTSSALQGYDDGDRLHIVGAALIVPQAFGCPALQLSVGSTITSCSR